MTDIGDAKRSSDRLLEEAEARIIFNMTFIVFLLGAIVSRLTLTRRGERQSIFAQARAATDRTVPFAFMN